MVETCPAYEEDSFPNKSFPGTQQTRKEKEVGLG